MQKAKKEDFRTEEELRTQKAKYEEANEEVYRRMQDVSIFTRSRILMAGLTEWLDQGSRDRQHHRSRLLC